MSATRQLLHPLYRKLETSVHPLRYLFLEITQRCNLKCLHCGSDCDSKPRPDELSTEEWLDFFTYLRGHTERDRLVLVVTGGEPLCHPQFSRLTGALADGGLTWGMVTNGHALTEARVARVVDHGISSVTVSLDGLSRTHDWLRGVEASYERAAAGIRRLAAADLPFFDVVTCVHPRNLGELPRLQQLLVDWGVPAWRLFSIFPRGRARQNPQLLLTADQFSQMLRFISQQRAALPGDGFTLQFSCEGYLPPALDRQVRSEPYFCRAGISIASVLCDGAISACPNISRSLVQGNIRSDDFMEIWDRGFAPYRDRSWMRQGDCVECKQWKRCLGNSMHLWDDEQQHPGVCTFEMTGDC